MMKRLRWYSLIHTVRPLIQIYCDCEIAEHLTKLREKVQ